MDDAALRSLNRRLDEIEAMPHLATIPEVVELIRWVRYYSRLAEGLIDARPMESAGGVRISMSYQDIIKGAVSHAYRKEDGTLRSKPPAAPDSDNGK